MYIFVGWTKDFTPWHYLWSQCGPSLGRQQQGKQRADLYQHFLSWALEICGILELWSSSLWAELVKSFWLYSWMPKDCSVHSVQAEETSLQEKKRKEATRREGRKEWAIGLSDNMVTEKQRKASVSSFSIPSSHALKLCLLHLCCAKFSYLCMPWTSNLE